MKYGDTTRFLVTSVDKKGRGCGKINGKMACAPFVFPGETISATMIKRRKRVNILRADEIINPSPNRIEPRCAFAGQCGGCPWQALSYDTQLDLKKNLVNDAFLRHNVPKSLSSITPSPELFFFRNRMDYCIGPHSELGLKEPGRWNSYLDLSECHLLSEDANNIMHAFRTWMHENNISPWNARTHQGYARYLVIREGKRTKQRMCTLITSNGNLPAKTALIDALKPYATTIYHGINPTITDISSATTLTLLHGDEFMEEEIAGKRFLIHPNAFFQTNTTMAEQLVAEVRRHVENTSPKTLLDLYCGVGLFTITLSDIAKKTIGVEIEESAIRMAEKNADINNISNTTFFAGKAETHVWDTLNPDCVIIDPPRAGLHPKIITTLCQRKPKYLIYVSCNYERFAEEWKSLSTIYTLTETAAFDLFPHSPHVELVNLLIRK